MPPLWGRDKAAHPPARCCVLHVLAVTRRHRDCSGVTVVHFKVAQLSLNSSFNLTPNSRLLIIVPYLYFKTCLSLIFWYNRNSLWMTPLEGSSSNEWIPKHMEVPSATRFHSCCPAVVSPISKSCKYGVDIPA